MLICSNNTIGIIAMHMGHEPRSERIDIRTTPTVKRLLQQAAFASHKHVSEFCLSRASRPPPARSPIAGCSCWTESDGKHSSMPWSG